MNYPLLRYLFGMILLIVAAFLVLPLAVAVIYGESSGIYFLYTMIAAGLLGFLLTRFKPAKRDMYAREGFVFTALAWVVISLIGAAPFTLSGQIPSYLDAVFETVSGFTTTGSTILTEATLSFLGLGVKYPFASWGNIINDVNNAYVMTNYLFIWVPAGICLLITVLGFNFVGDGLRDAFDPKMKR